LNIIVTGGAGFIGSNYIKYKLKNSDDKITVVDKLTYAGNMENIPKSDRIEFISEDICYLHLESNDFDAIINFAAETHVDRSINDPKAFIQTDVFGTYNLLEIAKYKNIRYLQVSTDEVYGSIDSGSFTEQSPIQPSSPYSASKAAADMLVYSYCKTYGVDALVVRGSNNYGPNQYPEKLIPLTILNVLHNKKVPVYGDGKQVRNWIYVEDFCSAIDKVLLFGKTSEVYNAGGPEETNNLDVVNKIIDALGKDESLIEFVQDRPGHDQRYSLGSEKVRELGWNPIYDFNHGLDVTVKWYLENQEWWKKILNDEQYNRYYSKQYSNN